MWNCSQILYTGLHARTCSRKTFCFSYLKHILKSHGLHELLSSTSNARTCKCKWFPRSAAFNHSKSQAQVSFSLADNNISHHWSVMEGEGSKSISSLTTVEPARARGHAAVPSSAGGLHSRPARETELIRPKEVTERSCVCEQCQGWPGEKGSALSPDCS